jgi:hypothetical protein
MAGFSIHHMLLVIILQGNNITTVINVSLLRRGLGFDRSIINGGFLQIPHLQLAEPQILPGANLRSGHRGLKMGYPSQGGH